MLKEIFGKKIKQLRIQKGMSQDKLSILSGIDRPQISKIEQGKINVTLETIERISIALGVKSSKLLDNKTTLRPFVKWAGGKTQLLDKLYSLMPRKFNNYYEPFVGGGSFFLSLAPTKSVINDFNSELICAYKCFQNEKLYNKLINELIKHEKNHSEEYYYQIRSKDRETNFLNLPIYVRAARMIYLNKACFNGLYRVNSKGLFNVPSGKKTKVTVFDKDNFKSLKKYFTNNDITILNDDFTEAVKKARKGDFVYFDPPYDTIENKKTFTSYSKNNFGKNEQKRLANIYKELDSRGVKVMLSNHNTAFINELYSKFKIHIVNAKRMINSKADERGNVEEVIITNYE
ncbi:Dam family site-specific DNA-(adenine-N6)-methyltransferase [Mycoplasmopsis synoviae]|uniref:Site-specific DNA-methyltransferase (adenine-specific) n=1 Tax=Mycoplasmopsis synoviae TaxID=2109 RepID=A0A3B0P6Q4_MYCSY|nr:Dam family site-specific DNA-(adenine-N6)-methyltransferase [Mycoplasmopsis synoviae]AKB10962.1 DNA methyltransferase [Mycoplasmopsis synoviae ATCC 25204]AKB11207.1 DNA methyltransferase [Mycoplasmopsis synoviae ATCC 25204]UBX97894.1 Dam family site-specific DNA-(adenine-N6)-methyltransferase [Mycoplasmopsis synoviae]UBX99410.1 Dam family site-specific DNA-(adenine-N6)-methyltransferase [Mycoplasmopsis synoviae]UBX99754.1 Dam family site-specific DNA-(adenine-N6)-methyltransferase [Mycoplas